MQVYMKIFKKFSLNKFLDYIIMNIKYKIIEIFS